MDTVTFAAEASRHAAQEDACRGISAARCWPMRRSAWRRPGRIGQAPYLPIDADVGANGEPLPGIPRDGRRVDDLVAPHDVAVRVGLLHGRRCDDIGEAVSVLQGLDGDLSQNGDGGRSQASENLPVFAERGNIGLLLNGSARPP